MRKSKKLIILVVSIIVAIIILATSTYSLYFKTDNLDNTESYTAGILDIVIENDEAGLGQTLTLANKLPITDEEGMTTTPYRFKITNRGNVAYKFNLKLNSTNPNGINPNYIKVMVDNKQPVILGNQADSIIVRNLSLNPGKSKTISVRVWLDINTSNSEIGKTYNGTLVGDGIAVEPSIEAERMDNSGANIPKITNDLVPVVYDETRSTWVRADITDPNGEYKWYDYDEKKWANAALVEDTNSETYLKASPGTPVPESAVKAYYVWIPRYKYKVWNINREIDVDSYDAYHTGIDIVFESGTSSTGTINCSNYSFATPTNVVGEPNETCSGSSGDYYTHPAFTFGDDELEGIWVGKFETTGSTSSITIKPNLTSLANTQVTSFANAIYNLLPHDGIKDSHMMKNMEWGAVAYLTNSDYGMCSAGVCNKVGVNNYRDIYFLYMTGCGASAESAISSTCSPYNTSSGMLASTTGNIYGVYDMSGGVNEFLMGKVSSEVGTFVFNTDSTYGELINNEDKYYDKYANSTNSTGQASRNKARLGDGTGEVNIKVGSTDYSWYGGRLEFPVDIYQWITRGDNITLDSGRSIFHYGNTNWNGAPNLGTRAVLAVY